MYTKEGVLVTLGFASVTFKQDTAYELACFLMSQADCLTPSSHQTLLSRFGLTEEDFQALDHDVMLAMAHGDFPPAWSTVGNSSGEGKWFSLFLPLGACFSIIRAIAQGFSTCFL